VEFSSPGSSVGSPSLEMNCCQKRDMERPFELRIADCGLRIEKPKADHPLFCLQSAIRDPQSAT
jgi:hypothetical protein